MIGRTVSNYRIEEKLGGGAMGVVYRAADLKLKRPVALKFLPQRVAHDEAAKKRFTQEARAASHLDHPNIASVHEIGETDDGRLYIVMPFYEGETLKKKLAGGQLPVEQAIVYATQLADGLAAAHRAGIVHRDIKPANVMITDDGTAKIVDFGLAKPKNGPELTRTGTTLGTPSYMSPEQVRGEAVDARSDLWSLGVVLYEMLTGRRPFEGEYEQSVLYAIVNAEAPSIRQRCPDVPDYLAGIVERLLQKDPENRYASAAALVKSLEQHRSTTSGDSSANIGLKRVTEKKRIVVYTIVAVLAVTAAYALLLSSSTKSEIDAIAVLPFANLSNDPDEEYFADGMTDALIAQLGQIGRLKVTSRQSVMRFKNSEDPLPEIADRLGVDAVLEGTVLPANGEVRVTAQLIDGRADEHVWAKSYARPMEDVLDLQRDIAIAVAQEIDVQLNADERERLSQSERVDPAAYKLYLRGRRLSWRFDTPSRRSAIKYLEQSIAHDSTFAPAYAELAMTYEDEGRAKEALRRALELDRYHPEVLLAEGKHQNNLYAKERVYRRALAVDPGHSLVRRELGWVLLWQGQPEKAAREMRQALELDPLSAHAHHSMANAYFYQGKYESAAEESEECLRLDPGYWLCHWDACETAIQSRDIDRALESINELKSFSGILLNPIMLDLRVQLLQVSTSAEKERILRRAHEAVQDGVSLTHVARLYAVAGKADTSLNLLRRAVSNQDHILFAILPHLHPDFAPVRRDARLTKVVEPFYRSLGQ